MSLKSVESIPAGAMPDVARHILGLKATLEDIDSRVRALKEQHEDEQDAAKREFAKEQEQADSVVAASEGPSPAEIQEQEAFLALEKERWASRLNEAEQKIRTELEEVVEQERRSTEVEIRGIRKQLETEETARRAPLDELMTQWTEGLPRVREQGSRAGEALARFASRHGVALMEPPPFSGAVDPEVDPQKAESAVTTAVNEARSFTEHARVAWGHSFARTSRLILYHAALLVALGGAIAVEAQLKTGAAAVGVSLGVAAVVVALMWITTGSVRRRYGQRVHELANQVSDTVRSFERHTEAALKRIDSLHMECAIEFRDKRNAAEAKVHQESDFRATGPRRRLSQLSIRAGMAEARLNAIITRRREAIRARGTAAREAAEHAREAAQAKRLAAHQARIDAIEGRYDEEMKNLSREREAALAEFEQFATLAKKTVEEASPALSEVALRETVLPREFPGLVPFGSLRVPVASLVPPPPEGEPREAGPVFEVPAVFAFPEQGSLLIEYESGKRDAAVEVLSNSVLRLLTSFPPGKARLTILDPVGLGQSFSALMHLADHDEKLVNSRIWTETQHIEQRLIDLTEHIEKVIQKYLRNRYETIAEYNVEAGELKEPCHFLLVADFPSGFSDSAIERLAGIVSSGSRCGVYTLMARDLRQEVPRAVDRAVLRRNGPVLRIEKAGLHLVGDGLDLPEFVPEPSPASKEANTLLSRIGQESVDADVVELPFPAVSPAPDAIWSGSTANSVKVAIGRTGADRLQFMELGRGTAQHALIAGRTGSGKSTFFHVMITNLSLWFSPDEIEFYLIDFKKGVEFKAFATHDLPHARVVAIESDREFGLSVLRAIDVELARRGDLFRRCGVQDVAAFRERGTGESMPRILLVIDEFQEYFTEDDAVARDAALLLDRFVRQGRAFGIHVVLGSQTLSGIYSLAKSTLGQMGVRIALQCNEADSYLILSEDNGVARLLNRPGEAIYNDKSGLLTGNNPFQVVWLPEDEEARQLDALAAKAARERPPREHEMVVFEGNVPADIDSNGELALLVAGRGGYPTEDDPIWLGEPNAIKGPTEVRFSPVSGSNLLIVGQHRDAAFSMMAAGVLSLVARRREENLRILFLDGGGHEPEFAEHIEDLLRAVPGRVERYDLRNAADAVIALGGEVDSRVDAASAGPPVYVLAFGLQRLRMLRQKDEFAMPTFGEEETASAGDRFATILTEGPPQNVHTIVWCDTAANLARTLSRKVIREFDMRVLFQMSAADSSELIDSSAGNLLGLHSALLAVESQGTFEKFRPYAIPPGEVMRRLGSPPPPPPSS